MEIIKMISLSVACYSFFITVVIGESIDVDSSVLTSSNLKKPSINGPKESNIKIELGMSPKFLLMNHQDDKSPSKKTAKTNWSRKTSPIFFESPKNLKRIVRNVEEKINVDAVSKVNVHTGVETERKSETLKGRQPLSLSSADSVSRADAQINSSRGISAASANAASSAKSLVEIPGSAASQANTIIEIIENVNTGNSNGPEKPQNPADTKAYSESFAEISSSAQYGVAKSVPNIADDIENPNRKKYRPLPDSYEYEDSWEDDRPRDQSRRSNRQRPGNRYSDRKSNPKSRYDSHGQRKGNDHVDDYDYEYDDEDSYYDEDDNQTRHPIFSKTNLPANAESKSFASSSIDSGRSKASSYSLASADAGIDKIRPDRDRNLRNPNRRRPNEQRGGINGRKKNQKNYKNDRYDDRDYFIQDNTPCRKKRRREDDYEESSDDLPNFYEPRVPSQQICPVRPAGPINTCSKSVSAAHINFQKGGGLASPISYTKTASMVDINTNQNLRHPQCNNNYPRRNDDCYAYGETCNIPESYSAPYLCDSCQKELISDCLPIISTCRSPGLQHQKRSIHTVKTLNSFDFSNFDHNCTDYIFFPNVTVQDSAVQLKNRSRRHLVSDEYMENQLSRGHNLATRLKNHEKTLIEKRIVPKPHTASMLHFFNNKASEKSIKLNEESKKILFGTQLLQKKLLSDHNISSDTFTAFLKEQGCRVNGKRICRRHCGECHNFEKYQSLDGSCNNLQNPSWGQTNTAFQRILPAHYSDGVWEVRNSVLGGDLPGARELSVNLYKRGNKLNPQLTLALMVWGQILAHDLGRQIPDQTADGGIECCAEGGESILPESLQHYSCLPIPISQNDPFYSSHGQRCINFIRSMTILSEDCCLTPAKQLNGATSYLDLSHVYGPDKSTSDKLRDFGGGRLTITFRKGRWLLPSVTNPCESTCDKISPDDVCYKTGDDRTNQNPSLVILQTVLVRRHNNLAFGLSKLNTHWNDERLFFEARRILIAEYQHITYNEWLPIILGFNSSKSSASFQSKMGQFLVGYNPIVNPSTLSDFTSGSFRVLHSIIDGDINFYNSQREVTEKSRLSCHYFRPTVIEKDDYFESLLLGLTIQPIHASGTEFHSDLTEYLFHSKKEFGMDLIALDIQRGRDHGLPGYNEYRNVCQLKVAHDFDDLSDEISRNDIEKLRKIYQHVDDIDLLVGASLESIKANHLLGPTNRCIITEQFYRSRTGDRYFYNHQDSDTSFTSDQLQEIRKASLSRLLCEMGSSISSIQQNSFETVSPKNPLVNCEELPSINLQPWKDTTVD